MKIQNKGRDHYVDELRGLAIFMVVFGHTMTGSTSSSENSFLFNVIWSLQMPLFMLISGYVNRYTSPIESGKDLTAYLKKRTLAYLLPWISWTFLIRGIIFREGTFLDLSYLVWHMDSGYWFLFSIWIISIVFGVAQYFARKNKTGPKVILFHTALNFILGMILLGILGIILGMSFFGIKQTVYYMPFFLAGYIFGEIRTRITYTNLEKWIERTVTGCCIVYVIILLRYNLYTISDGLVGIIVRMIAAFSGCIVVCGLSKAYLNRRNCVSRILNWGGYTL